MLLSRAWRPNSTSAHLVKALVEPGALPKARFPAQCRTRRDRPLTLSPLAHAVLSGRIDQKLFGALGRAESLRLIADYTGTPLDAKTAADTVSRAETFVNTVEKAFALSESSITSSLKNDSPIHKTKYQSRILRLSNLRRTTRG